MAVDAVGRRPYQVERWFGIITQRAIRRGSFSSVLAPGLRAAVGADRPNRAVRRGLHQKHRSIHLDCYGGRDP